MEHHCGTKPCKAFKTNCSTFCSGLEASGETPQINHYLCSLMPVRSLAATFGVAGSTTDGTGDKAELQVEQGVYDSLQNIDKDFILSTYTFGTLACNSPCGFYSSPLQTNWHYSTERVQ